MPRINSPAGCLRNQVRAGISKREDFLLQPSKTALLIIDVQTYLTSPLPPDLLGDSYFWKDAVPRMVRNLVKLVETFREARDNETGTTTTTTTTTTGCEIIFTFLQAATKDGRDISLDYKLSGPELAGIPRVTDNNTDDLFLRDLQPNVASGKCDILLPMTSCSVFQSTNLDYLLRNLGIEQLVITGQLTDQCVESAVRDAADLGYFVTLVEDACAAKSENAHQKGLQSMKGFSRIVSSEKVMTEIEQALRCDSVNAEQQNGTGKQNIFPTQAKLLEFLKERGFEDAASALAEAYF